MPTKKKAVSKKAGNKKPTNKKAATKKAGLKKPAAKKTPTKKAAQKKPAVKKKPAVAEAISIGAMNLKMDFELGVGEVKMVHASGGLKVIEKKLDTSGTVKFDNVKSNDTVTVTGSTAGSAKLSTDRDTTPASSTPIKFVKDITKLLFVN